MALIHTTKGHFVVGRKTEGKGVRKKLQELNQRLRALKVEGGKATMAYFQDHVRGHIQYYGVSGNIRGVTSYIYFAGKLLFKWLNRRSQRRSVPWERFSAILTRGSAVLVGWGDEGTPT